MRAVVAKYHHADIVGLEIERHAANAAGEFDHFAHIIHLNSVETSEICKP